MQRNFPPSFIKSDLNLVSYTSKGPPMLQMPLIFHIKCKSHFLTLVALSFEKNLHQNIIGIPPFLTTRSSTSSLTCRWSKNTRWQQLLPSSKNLALNTPMFLLTKLLPPGNPHMHHQTLIIMKHKYSLQLHVSQKQSILRSPIVKKKKIPHVRHS